MEPQDRIDDLEEALHRIVQWSEAYPLEAFPEPSGSDWVKAAVVLKEAGLSIDAISASCMRHVAKGAAIIAKEALNSPHPTPDQK